MAQNPFYRQVEFERVSNIRDLGGYRARNGKKVAKGRLFRSGDLCRMSNTEFTQLKECAGLTSVIDLRNNIELDQKGTGCVKQSGVRYYSVPFTTGNSDSQKENELFKRLSDLGDVYLYFIRHQQYGQRIIQAMEIIADTDNLPLIFHCSAGKDRTGVLAAMVLSVLGVAEEDIVRDYALTAPYIKLILEQYMNERVNIDDSQILPGYFFSATPESMFIFLSGIKHEFGSIKGYLMAHGADKALFDKLEQALLV